MITTAFTIKGGITYTVDNARILAFEGIKPHINTQEYKAFLFDKNFIQNKNAIIKNKLKFRDREIQIFSDGKYSILFKKNTTRYFIYNTDGKLEIIVFYVNNKYPKKSVAYDIYGNLSSIAFSVKKDEQFVFNKNKKLIAHWIGKNCYNEQGELIMTRE